MRTENLANKMLIGTILVILAVAVALGFYFRRRRQWKLGLRCWIRLEGWDGASATFEPPEPGGLELMGTAVLFTAKLHWLLLSEPTELQEHFASLVHAAVEVGDWTGENPLEAEAIRSPLAIRSFVANAEPPTEEYYLEFFSTSSGAWFLRNTLPPRAALLTSLLAYLVLLVEVVGRLTSAERQALRQALEQLLMMLRSPQAKDAENSGLLLLFEYARTSLDMALAQQGLKLPVL